jgi:ABC-type multidrug transport system fused ATPase/permease subunit
MFTCETEHSTLTLSITLKKNICVSEIVKFLHDSHVSFLLKGLIEFKNMSLFYDVNAAPALKNFNITIEPAMKVGIVGR